MVTLYRFHCITRWLRPEWASWVGVGWGWVGSGGFGVSGSVGLGVRLSWVELRDRGTDPNISLLWGVTILTLRTHHESWAPFQYPIRRLNARSRKASKPRDLSLELSDRSEIWQAPQQQGCRSACQISKRCDNLNYQSRGFETSRDLTIRRLIGYWNGAQQAGWQWDLSSADYHEMIVFAVTWFGLLLLQLATGSIQKYWLPPSFSSYAQWWLGIVWILIIPHTMKLMGGILVSLRPSRIPCPLCSTHSSGWIHFIFVIHLIKQLQKVCHV